MSFSRRLWCKLDDAVQCNCDHGICLGGRHLLANKHWAALRSYGLTIEEAMDDLAESARPTEGPS